MPQQDNLDPDFTVIENLQVYGADFATPQLVEPLTSPLAMLPLAWWLMGPAAAITWTLALLALLAMAALSRRRQSRRA